MTTKLKAPIENGSCTHAGVTYEIKDGAVEVSDDAAAELAASHGFSPYVDAPEGEDLDQTEPTIDRREAAIRTLDRMERPELILACKDAGIEVVKGWNNGVMRARLREAAGIDPPRSGVVDMRQSAKHEQIQETLAAADRLQLTPEQRKTADGIDAALAREQAAGKPAPNADDEAFGPKVA